MKDYKKTILVTGGAGFIGSHVVRHFTTLYPDYFIVNFDALTYAGNLENLKDVENTFNYAFIKGDIRNIDDIRQVFSEFGVTDVIHLAAESHVDRSIKSPNIFAETNIIGTINMLNVVKDVWKDDYSVHRFHHVSTDEVYGSLDMNPENKFRETTPYNPHSPYSASKASSDQFVRAYHDTYGLNVTISNCSNNYGPNQFPEKLIPLVINNLKLGKEIPVYGTGMNVRDWLYVEDHASAIDTIFHNGVPGETYNVGGDHEMANIDVVKEIIKCFAHERRLIGGIKYFLDPEPTWRKEYERTIRFIPDRKGHDIRYAIDCSKLKTELNWKRRISFNEGLENTVRWYLEHSEWLDNCTSGTYKEYYSRMYDNG